MIQKFVNLEQLHIYTSNFFDKYDYFLTFLYELKKL
jgi:hypothetical protein